MYKARSKKTYNGMETVESFFNDISNLCKEPEVFQNKYVADFGKQLR